jgi:hypothetical protein
MMRRFAVTLLVLFLFSPAIHAAEGWLEILGGPLFEEAFIQQSSALMKVNLSQDRMAEEAQACPAFVNAYLLSRDLRYKEQAKKIADFLVTHSNLAQDSTPGWGPKLEEGYGFCQDEDDYKGKDLWDTSRALDCLLKFSEIESQNQNYINLAKKVIDSWPSVEKQLPQAPFASQGMRFYSKSPVSCARKYVKNTNIAMGEALYRLARLTKDPRYTHLAEQVLNAELWEVLTRRNFGYHGAMIYVEPNDSQNQKVLEKEKNKVETDPAGNIVCRSKNPDPSCWNHLAFEAYELYQVQRLSGRDLSEAIWNVMKIYRTSPLGDTKNFPWEGSESPTHITAYNCYLRNSGKSIYREECERALQHKKSSTMIFYSLIPDDLVK